MENLILIIIMLLLGIIEIGLIFSIRSLILSLEKMNDKLQAFDHKLTIIAGLTSSIYDKIKLVSSGEMHIKGNTPVGNVDLDLIIGRKEE